MKDKKPKAKNNDVVGLPLSSDYQESGIKYDPSQKSPEPKKGRKKVTPS